MVNKQFFLKTFLFLVTMSHGLRVSAAEPSVSYKLYGFVRNDFYYNSRQNVEALDGIFNIFPKPRDLNTTGEDKNDIANAEMLSVATRLGLDLSNAQPVLGAKTTAKIECDFAGFSTNYYVIRLRQAFVKFNWATTELLVGQTWHPLFGTVMPTIPSLNTGAPFQPFNRSPQLKLKQSLGTDFSLTAVAAYQMQYMSQGPNGTSASYMKNAIQPDLFASVEYKSGNVISGLGFDTKAIKIYHQLHRSMSTVAYGQYVDKKLQIKAKAVYGQNLSDHLMIGGYGVSGTDTKYNEATYTNFKTLSVWGNVVYGTKVQIGIFGGLSQNLGTEDHLLANTSNKFTAYGYGFYADSQNLLDKVTRISPSVTYNAGNIKLALEYELTAGKYGTIRTDGRVDNPYTLNNHRVSLAISYIF